MNSEMWYIFLTIILIMIAMVDIYVKILQLRTWKKMVEKEEKEKWIR